MVFNVRCNVFLRKNFIQQELRETFDRFYVLMTIFHWNLVTFSGNVKSKNAFKRTIQIFFEVDH